MPIINANGHNLYYEFYGQGRPLVLINGLAADISGDKSLITDLSKQHRVLVFDNRDVGRSDRMTTPYSIHDMAEDTAALMRQLDWQRANIMGISMGGRIALDLALTHPEMVNKLFLVSTSARVKPSWRRSLLFNTLPRLPLFKGKYPQSFEAFQRQRRASANFDVRDQLSKITAPTLILHGKQDWLAPFQLAEELQQGIKDSILLSFAGKHMFFQFRQREPFIKAVYRFSLDA